MNKWINQVKRTLRFYLENKHKKGHAFKTLWSSLSIVQWQITSFFFFVLSFSFFIFLLLLLIVFVYVFFLQMNKWDILKIYFFSQKNIHPCVIRYSWWIVERKWRIKKRNSRRRRGRGRIRKQRRRGRRRSKWKKNKKKEERNTIQLWQ